MPLTSVEFETGPNPRAAIVLMHGLGADGNDFVPIANELDLSVVGPVRFVFPNAPIIPVTINGGYPMPAWYDIRNADLLQREDEAGLRQNQLALEEVIARQKAKGIPAERIVLAGFSQGCAMALMVGLRHAEKLAGIVGLSGYLPLASLTAAERHEANATTRIFLGHGRQDGVVPVVGGRASRDALQALGYGVLWKEYDMAHSVCMEEIGDINAFLVDVLTAS